jgi:hypothetical protein
MPHFGLGEKPKSKDMGSETTNDHYEHGFNLPPESLPAGYIWGLLYGWQEKFALPRHIEVNKEDKEDD